MSGITEKTTGGALTMSEEELVSVLSNSIYPGAKLESIKMVIGYCRASRLDPLQKPVHIVPMNVKKPGSRNDYEWRDVVMPGIGLYRTQAARSGLVGIDEPEFGPMVPFPAGGKDFMVPEYCRVTVYRMVGGERCAFTGLEFWVENYATAGRDTTAPNAMWSRRPRGQLAKCAEAQALRKAFPELGAAPTAEEMQGRSFDDDLVDVNHAPAQSEGFKVGKRSTGTTTTKTATKAKKGEVIDAEPVEEQQAQQPANEQAPADEPLVGVGERKYLENKASSIGVDLNGLLEQMGGLDLERLTKSDFQQVKAELSRIGG